MMKKMIALVLALVLCFTLFAGCSKDEATEEPTGLNYAAAYAKYAPETVVMNINGTDVTWDEFYYLLYSAVNELQYYLGDIVWDKECIEGYGVTFEEYTMQLTMDGLRQYHAIETQAEKMEITFTDEDKQKLDDLKTAYILSNIGEDATEEDLAAHLMEKFYLSLDMFDFINKSSVLYEKLFQESIGAQGEKLTDADIQSFVAEAPYVTAKHILLMTVDSATGEALSEEKVKQAEETAKQLLEKLQGIPKRDKLVSTFDSLMQEYNEDPGVTLFPNGYTFTTGQMYPVFEQAAFALEEYQISDIVKSEAGYHILLRLPTTRDSLVDFDYENSIYYTIETYAATHVFNRLMSGWMNECEVEWTEEFKDITAEAIFAE